jgi:hypothetical protein
MFQMQVVVEGITTCGCERSSETRCAYHANELVKGDSDLRAGRRTGIADRLTCSRGCSFRAFAGLG